MKNEIVVSKLIAYADKILGYCEGVDHERFCADSKLVEACAFNLGQMGELTKRIDEAFATAHADIPWKHIYGLRNRIVHDYEGVNLQLIWEIIESDLKPLRDQLASIWFEELGL